MPKRAAEGEDGAQSSHIRTFLRIRPSKKASGYIKIDEHDKTRLGFHVPVETRDGEVSVMNHNRLSWKTLTYHTNIISYDPKVGSCRRTRATAVRQYHHTTRKQLLCGGHPQRHFVRVLLYGV